MSITTFPIITPEEITECASAGAKAYRLKLLITQGYQVPEFFCLPAVCYQQYRDLAEEEKCEFKHRLQKELADYAAFSFPEEGSFSVRTSAMAEDGEHASYAGQFKTLLRIPPERLGEAVVQCWEALSNINVEAYRKKCALEEDSLLAGIIIQRMIEADLSGVAFSVNPQGILNESVIVCGQGTGDNVVEDKVPVTTYYYNQHSGQFYYEQESGGALLEQTMLQQLTDALQKLGAESPVDIEYAVCHNQLWMLQQRPVTAVSLEEPIVLDNSNIVESYGGLCLPLTISFAKYVYTQVFKGLARRCLPKKALAQYDTVLKQMVNSANGRMYYQISNWYTVLKFLPMQHKIIPVWQRMMGVQTKQYSKAANPVTFFQRPLIYCNIIGLAIGIPKKMEALGKDFTQAQELFQSKFRSGMDAGQLDSLFHQLAHIVLRDWDITLLNDMYAFLFSGLLERQFQKSGIGDYQQQSNRFLSGNREMESLRPLQEAWMLAQELRKNSELHKRFTGFQNNEEVERYLADAEDVLAPNIRHYLELYGDRSQEELKLEAQTFRSNPIAFIHLLLAYADGDIPKPEGTSLTEEDMPPQIGFFRRGLIRYLGKKARLGIANREASRLNRGRIFGMVRSIFTEMGWGLYRKGLLVHPRDVFYLYMEELFAYAHEENTGELFQLCVKQRKSRYEGFALLPAYSRLIFEREVFDKHTSFAQCGQNIVTDGLLRGTPCSQGIIEGQVVVVTEPVSADAVQDKILVARTTDPGWVFLLAAAKGVIAEKGSLLSHTAIITRELGLPSIVGVDHITEILKTGDKVRMDGGKGTIEKY